MNGYRYRTMYTCILLGTKVLPARLHMHQHTQSSYIKNTSARLLEVKPGESGQSIRRSLVRLGQVNFRLGWVAVRSQLTDRERKCNIFRTLRGAFRNGLVVLQVVLQDPSP
jgi:hypothetical protein